MPAILPFSMPWGPECNDPHRWIDLSDPYLGYGRSLRCPENYDPNPRPGEVGLGMTYDTGQDLTGWSAEWVITKPSGSICYRSGCIDDTSVTLISDIDLFTEPGVYTFHLHLCSAGRTWPHRCLKIAVQC